MVIDRNSGLYKFASWFKNSSTQFDMKYEDQSISLCRLFWFTIHSVCCTLGVILGAFMAMVFLGFFMGLPMLSIPVSGSMLFTMSWVLKALTLFMGFAILVTAAAACFAVIMAIVYVATWVSERKFSVPDSIQERMTVFSIVPEFVKAKKAKFCPTIKIE